MHSSMAFFVAFFGQGGRKCPAEPDCVRCYPILAAFGVHNRTACAWELLPKVITDFGQFLTGDGSFGADKGTVLLPGLVPNDFCGR